MFGNVTTTLDKWLSEESWNRIRQRVLRRDNYECQPCGSKINLDVHHIRARRYGGSNSLYNLITLCRRCHRRLEPHSTMRPATVEQHKLLNNHDDCILLSSVEDYSKIFSSYGNKGALIRGWAKLLEEVGVPMDQIARNIITELKSIGNLHGLKHTYKVLPQKYKRKYR